MRIADFLYRKLGLNIFKAAPHLKAHTPEIPATAEVEPEPLEPPTPINTSTTDVIHIGPRGVGTRWMPMAARCTSRPAEVAQTHRLDDKLS